MILPTKDQSDHGGFYEFFPHLTFFAREMLVKKPESKWMNMNQTRSARRWGEAGPATLHKSSTWNGNLTMQEACTLAMRGWENGWKEVEQSYLTIVDENKPIRRRSSLINSVEGFRPNVPHYLSGRPDCMLHPRRHRVNAPCVRIKISIGALCSVNAEGYRKRGAAVCAFIDTVESIGVSTELSAVSKASAHDSTFVEVEIQLKTAGQPLDMDSIAFGISHPSMLRRLVFRWRERDAFYEKFHRGYGSSRDPDVDGDQILLPTLDSDDNELTPQEHYVNLQKAVEEKYRLSEIINAAA